MYLKLFHIVYIRYDIVLLIRNNITEILVFLYKNRNTIPLTFVSSPVWDVSPSVLETSWAICYNDLDLAKATDMLANLQNRSPSDRYDFQEIYEHVWQNVEARIDNHNLYTLYIQTRPTRTDSHRRFLYIYRSTRDTP